MHASIEVMGEKDRNIRHPGLISQPLQVEKSAKAPCHTQLRACQRHLRLAEMLSTCTQVPDLGPELCKRDSTRPRHGRQPHSHRPCFEPVRWLLSTDIGIPHPITFFFTMSIMTTYKNRAPCAKTQREDHACHGTDMLRHDNSMIIEPCKRI